MRTSTRRVGSQRGWHLATAATWSFRSCLTSVPARFVSNRCISYAAPPSDRAVKCGGTAASGNLFLEGCVGAIGDPFEPRVQCLPSDRSNADWQGSDGIHLSTSSASFSRIQAERRRASYKLEKADTSAFDRASKPRGKREPNDGASLYEHRVQPAGPSRRESTTE